VAAGGNVPRGKNVEFHGTSRVLPLEDLHRQTGGFFGKLAYLFRRWQDPEVGMQESVGFGSPDSGC
jgi:hypothetical protein